MNNAQDTITRLNKWLNVNTERNIKIEWKWAGRDRAGKITATENNKKLVTISYARNSMKWDDADSIIDSLHTGSSKHRALEELANAIGA